MRENNKYTVFTLLKLTDGAIKIAYNNLMNVHDKYKNKNKLANQPPCICIHIYSNTMNYYIWWWWYEFVIKLDDCPFW